MAKTTKTSGSKKKTVSRPAPEKKSASKPVSTEAKPVVTTKVESKPRARRRLAFREALRPSRLLAELVGTFVLTLVIIATLSGKFAFSFFATPDIISQATASGQAIPSFALTPFIGGLALVALVLATYRISGGLLNPAITLGQMALRRMKVLEGLGYIVAQFLGAMLALSVATRLISVFDPALGEQVALNPANLFSHASTWNVFFAELLGAFIFGFGVAAAYSYRELPKALLIGASFVLGIGVALMAGAGMLNPAVAVGVGLIGFGSGDLWGLIGIYLGGSTLGIVIGMALHALLSRGETTREPSAAL